MAYSYQIACPPGSKATIADLVTLRGGAAVTILNAHASEPLYIGGNENEPASATTLSTSTGFKLAAGAAYSTVLNGNEAIYGRSGTSTVTVTAHVFRSDARV